MLPSSHRILYMKHEVDQFVIKLPMHLIKHNVKIVLNDLNVANLVFFKCHLPLKIHTKKQNFHLKLQKVCKIV